MPKNNFQAHFNANSYRFFAKRSNVQQRKRRKKHHKPFYWEQKYKRFEYFEMNCSERIMNQQVSRFGNISVTISFWRGRDAIYDVFGAFIALTGKLCRPTITSNNTHHWHKQPLVSMYAWVCVCVSKSSSFIFIKAHANTWQVEWCFLL